MAHYTDAQLDEMYDQSKTDRHGLVGSEVRCLIGDIREARKAAAPAVVPGGRVSDEQDAIRYRRLRVLGCAPDTSKQLGQGTVLRFTGLDAFVDADLATVKSRGEAHPVQIEAAGGNGEG